MTIIISEGLVFALIARSLINGTEKEEEEPAVPGIERGLLLPIAANRLLELLPALLLLLL